ncbi:MAG: hypothetical protein K2H51_02205, partial [Malacoplasma sp.]|nr:hypothetical protein [Malacoplasma sp.]
DKYSNVNVTYVPNSASFTTNTFKVNVTPVEGAIWENTATNNEQRTVTVKIDKAARIPDATVPAKSKNSSFNITVNDTNIKTDADLNNWMKNYFNTKFNLSHFTPETPDYVFKNVNLTYVENSASIANKSFKVKATPTDGHAWSNNTFYKDTFVDPFEMDIWFLNLVTKDKFITLPDRWGINLIMATNFPFKNFHSSHLQWKNISWILEDDFDTYWYNHNPKYYDDLSVKYQHLLFEEGWKDIARYYPVELSGTFEQCEWSWIQRINGGATFNFKVPMKPKAGYYWADGTNGTRMVHLNLFLSADQDAGPGILSDVSDMNYIKTFNQKESAATDGLPVRSWVTNDLIIIGEKLNKPTFEENVKVLENIAKDDLVKSFPNYNIEISDVKSTSWGDPWWIPDTWTYKIKFTSKTNPSYSKTMDGYIFTIN